jgi:phosphate transport system substrate-binding protein
MSVRKFLCIAAGLCLALGCSACNERPNLEGKIVLKGAGATFPNALYQKWVAVYNEKNKGVHIEYESVGSGEGIKRFMGRSNKPVDFGASDAALSLDDMEKAEKEGSGVLLVPSCGGSIVLAYNIEGLGGPLKLPRDVYPDIFLGNITRWDDERIQKANPDLNLPAKSIAVAVRQESSGTTFAFTNHLAAISPEWRERFGNTKSKEPDYLGVTKPSWPGVNVLPAPGNEGVAGMIRKTPYSIGYVEFGVAESNKLEMAWLQNKDGKFIKPGGHSGLAALIDEKLHEKKDFRDFIADPAGKLSYPIVSYTWLLVYRKYDDRQKEVELKKFLDWCLTDGQKFNESLGFLRLPPQTAHEVLEAIGPHKK